MANYFKPRARILSQLGDQLIKNESIALLEIIKNSYDADASYCNVHMEEVEDKKKGKITIKDDGFGMNKDIVENVWLEPGSDFKSKIVEKKSKTPRFGRLPIGEKGIGRFAVHKLGNKITLITRKKKFKEVIVEIDWKNFDKYKYLEEVPIDIKEREPIIFKGTETGTLIIIEDLQEVWNKTSVREIDRAIQSLNSPFKTLNTFKATLTIDKENWLEGLIDIKQLREWSLYHFKCVLKGGKIIFFHYKFIPYQAMTKLKARTVTQKDKNIKKMLQMVDNDDVSINLDKQKIGKVIFEGLIFDKEPKALELGVTDKAGLKKYLKENGGIRVYRDGIRVYDYGEPENDWLGLDLRRVNVPGKRVSNNMIIGSIILHRANSKGLREKTNREGFVENQAYKVFVQSILYTLSLIETQRVTDKDKVRALYGPKSTNEPVVVTVSELKNVIEEKVKDQALRTEIITYLQRIENEFEHINTVLLKSAGAGLSLTVALHEIEKIILELKRVVDSQRPSQRILNLVQRLFDLIEAYGKLARGRGRKKENLINILDDSIFAIEYRLKVHKVELIKKYKEISYKPIVNCENSLMISAFLNLFDNAIWWLNYYEPKPKKIFISIDNELTGYYTITFADNGKGFTIPPEEAVKPFVFAKPNGMGIGLHIVQQVIEIHKGILSFPTYRDTNLPSSFKEGALIKISLKKY